MSCSQPKRTKIIFHNMDRMIWRRFRELKNHSPQQAIHDQSNESETYCGKSLEFVRYPLLPIWPLYNTAAENSINETPTHHALSHSIKEQSTRQERSLGFSRLFILSFSFALSLTPSLRSMLRLAHRFVIPALYCPGTVTRTANHMHAN